MVAFEMFQLYKKNIDYTFLRAAKSLELQQLCFGVVSAIIPSA